MNQAQDYEFNLWDDGDTGTPESYPFIYGPDGQGEIHASEENEPENQPAPSSTDNANARPSPTAESAGPSASDGSQAPQSQPGVVSYAIPTVNTPLSQLAASTSVSDSTTSPSTTSSSSTTITRPNFSSVPPSTALAVTRTSAPTLVPSSTIPTTLSTPLPTSVATQEAPAESESVVPTTSVLFATPTPPPPTPSTAVQAFRHTPGFIVLIILCLLVFLGTLFASLSWLVRRRTRRKEDENWVGTLVYDEPSDYGGGSIAEHKNIGRKNSNELEKGEEQDEFETGEDSGRAGVGAAPMRGWSSHTGPVEPVRTYTTTARQFTNTPMCGYGPTTAPNVYTPASSHHGFTPNPDYRRASVLQRGPPAVSDYDSYGLDSGGLTFRRDIAGPYLAPVSEHEHDHSDIVTPNPFPPNSNPDPRTRRPETATVHDSASHYSYALDRAGPFAVTNLLPGDISSASASSSSLAGVRPRSLGLPAGRLDDPNPWKRYEGVENRGGLAGAGTEATVPDEAGWVGSFRSAVGRFVGGTNKPPESEEEADKFTPMPNPVPRRTRDTSKPTTQSSGAGRQARILQRLGSTGTTNTELTTCSSDDGQVFTRATSRRGTISTWTTTRSRSQGARGKKEDKDDGAGAGGATMLKTRTMSAASSEWGSGELVRVLGLSGRKRVD